MTTMEAAGTLREAEGQGEERLGEAAEAMARTVAGTCPPRLASGRTAKRQSQ